MYMFVCNSIHAYIQVQAPHMGKSVKSIICPTLSFFTLFL